MRPRILAFVLVVAVSLSGLAGQEAEGATGPAFSWGLSDIKVNWFGVVPTGAVLKFGYGSLGLFPGLRSDLEGLFGAGYENFPIYRGELDRDPLADWGASSLRTDMADAQLQLGFRQGLLPLEAKRDLLAAYASFHARWASDFGAGLPGGTSFVDRFDEAMGSLVAGLSYDDSTIDAHGLRHGRLALLEGEWGPSFLSLQGTDFARARAQLIQYLPLFDLEGERNLLSAYLAFGAYAKYVDGAQVPLFALNPTDVRGYPIGLDSKFRASAKLEARLNLPSLLGKSDILPLLFAFVDSGWYQGFADTLPSSTWSGASGALASVGAGFAIDVFGFARPYVAIAYPLLDADSAGHALIGAEPLSLGFGFNLQPESVFGKY